MLLEAETPILWPRDVENRLIGKAPDAGKDWGQDEKGTTEDEMVGWYHQRDGHEFMHGLGVGDGQGSLACWSPWGHKQLDTTERLNWTDCEACWILVPQLETESNHPAVESWSLNHNTARQRSDFQYYQTIGRLTQSLPHRCRQFPLVTLN